MAKGILQLLCLFVVGYSTSLIQKDYGNEAFIISIVVALCAAVFMWATMPDR